MDLLQVLLKHSDFQVSLLFILLEVVLHVDKTLWPCQALSCAHTLRLCSADGDDSSLQAESAGTFQGSR